MERQFYTRQDWCPCIPYYQFKMLVETTGTAALLDRKLCSPQKAVLLCAHRIITKVTQFNS